MEIIVKELVELAKQLGRQEVRAEFYENKYIESQDDIKKRIERGNKLQSEVNQLTDENADLKEQLKKLKESTKPAKNDESLPDIPEGFVRHDGLGRPVMQDTNVIVVFRNNTRTKSQNKAEKYFWNYTGDGSDIIAYKVIEE